jgi:hypothetical protein
MTAPSFLYHGTGVKVNNMGIHHRKVVLGKKETLDEIWRRKMMRRRRLTMKGLGYSLASWRTLFISRDFYFHALGSLVVLSFPQPLSFSSILPKPLSETLTRSSDGRISV